VSTRSSKSTIKHETISRVRLRRTIGRWHDTTGSGTTYYSRPGGELPRGLPLPDEVALLMEQSETGSALFWSLAGSHLVLPPFPVDRSLESQGWHAGPLQSLLDRPRRVAVFLLRMGGYAVGVFEGERLAVSKVGTRFVKGRHKKGGSSSSRFARRREEQARGLFDKACEEFRTLIEPQRKGLEHLVLGGDRHTLQAFEKRCPYLSSLAKIRLKRVLEVPDPRLKVLQATSRLLYESRVATFQPELTV